MAAPPRGCSPPSGTASLAWPEAEACGRGRGGGRGPERGDEGAARGSGRPFLHGRECGGVGVGADGGGSGGGGARQGCGSGKGGPGPRSRSLARRSGCADTEKTGTHQGGTTCDWEAAPRRRS